MTFIKCFNSQYSLQQYADFFIRLLFACLCGAAIGFERTKRFKEAGIRTHIIVCCTAALVMVVSKYGFADLTLPNGSIFNGTRGADPARVAAQVVSGISFLCAGVIFKNGNTVKGLTTAAGIWGTACIGLAIGAGMWPVGLLATVLISILQIVMHRFTVGADSYATYRLRITVIRSEASGNTLEELLKQWDAQATDCSIKRLDGMRTEYDMVLKMRGEITMEEINRVMDEYREIADMAVDNG